jgi:hypothetical protein
VKYALLIYGDHSEYFDLSEDEGPARRGLLHTGHTEEAVTGRGCKFMGGKLQVATLSRGSGFGDSGDGIAILSQEIKKGHFMGDLTEIHC